MSNSGARDCRDREESQVSSAKPGQDGFGDLKQGKMGPVNPPMDEQHPRGTLAIVIVFGALFALGWLVMFLFFLERGAPHL
jgi:hypothetical protein